MTWLLAAISIVGVLLTTVWPKTMLVVALLGLLAVWAGLLPARWGTLPAGTSSVDDGNDMQDLKDYQVDLTDAEVPEAIRQAVLAQLQPGDVLWRCPRLGPARGLLAVLGIGPRSIMMEWWLESAEGELVDIFWLDTELPA
ncbi:hypothetical protein [Ottowia sp.]|uniref:hypothetical protein n=1 Tax=Ottowia sp. TaxID=1898956 RepID=UPI003A8B3570